MKSRCPETLLCICDAYAGEVVFKGKAFRALRLMCGKWDDRRSLMGVAVRPDFARPYPFF